MMNSNNTNYPETKPFNDSPMQLSAEILLGFATGPLLVGVLCGKASLKFLQSLGEASEEVFRGHRLPVLQFPNAQTKGN